MSKKRAGAFLARASKQVGAGMQAVAASMNGVQSGLAAGPARATEQGVVAVVGGATKQGSSSQPTSCPHGIWAAQPAH